MCKWWEYDSLEYTVPKRSTSSVNGKVEEIVCDEDEDEDEDVVDVRVLSETFPFTTRSTFLEQYYILIWYDQNSESDFIFSLFRFKTNPIATLAEIHTKLALKHCRTLVN